MARYLINRALQMVLVFNIFLVFSYLLFNAMPGNAFQNLLLNPSLPPNAYEKTLELYGLNEPLLERLKLYIIKNWQFEIEF